MEERNKVLSVARTFLKYRQKNLEQILTEEGILLRINRSIQVEGYFGDLKQNMGFRRYLSRGGVNVLAESGLFQLCGGWTSNALFIERVFSSCCEQNLAA